MIEESTLKTMKQQRDNVLLMWEEAQDEYVPGILRPETQKLRHYTGVCVNKGPWVEDISVGDRVFFDQFCSPKTFYYDKTRYCIVREKNCLATLEPRVAVNS